MYSYTYDYPYMECGCAYPTGIHYGTGYNAFILIIVLFILLIIVGISCFY